MKELYERYKCCVVQINIKTQMGELATGTGFHIGDGYIVTARHIVEDHSIESVVGTYPSRNVTIKHIFYPSRAKIDLAVLETDFSLDHYLEKTTIIEDGKPQEKADRIPLGGHLDDWIGDELVLSRVVAFGYPRIPHSKEHVLVAVQGEINTVIDKYSGPHPHFIISSIAREGFLGGPVISEYDFLLGVLTESLTNGDQALENGFASVISIEPLLVLLHENKICIRGNDNILYDITGASSSKDCSNELGSLHSDEAETAK
jgi:S1-C subfamily serine protease